MRYPVIRLLFAFALSLPAPAAIAQQCPPSVPVQGAPPPAPLPLFPADNWWNVDISSAPVDPASASFIAFIGGNRRLHPDFGGEESPGSTAIYGFPYVVVGGSQAKRAVTFDYWDESDGVDPDTGEGVPFYPIPAQAATQPRWVEGGAPGNVDQRADADRHLLLIDCDNRHLYELYNVYYSNAQQKWFAGSGAFFDLDRNDRRPEGWTSADAAGLPIFPGLVRYDEAAVGRIEHAIRVTFESTRDAYVHPASHCAGDTASASAPPMGLRLRLKPSYGLGRFSGAARVVAEAMKRYGLIVADNGSNWYFGGTSDRRWDDENLNQLKRIPGSAFEVVRSEAPIHPC